MRALWKRGNRKKQTKTLLASGRESNSMATHSTAAWARIARESKAEDLWCSYRLTQLSTNQIVLLNEKGFRCLRESCGRYVEFKAETWRRGSNGSRGHHATEYTCPDHARHFAQERGLDWPTKNIVPDELPAEDVKP